MSFKEKVLELLEGIALPPGEHRKTCASIDSIQDFGRRTGLVLPHELQDWLQVMNGSRIGPGGILGIRNDDPYCDIETILTGYPEWQKAGWIPIAGDGCGNYYVIVTDGKLTPIVFIDTVADYLKPAYVAASGLWVFVWFLLKSELGETGWPFCREFVMQHDPEIECCTFAPMPWDA
jgi:hypothetical protein